MKEITIKLYSYDELSEKAKSKAIELLKEDGKIIYDDWYESTKDEHMGIIKEAGFSVTNTYFSGFWSQGDGAMFEYGTLKDKLLEEFVDTLPLTPMRKRWILNNVTIDGRGRHKGTYYHEKSCDHTIYWEVDNADLQLSSLFYGWLMTWGEGFDEFVISKYEDLCSDYYSALREEYRYLGSDEFAIENAREFGEVFLENGEEY